MQCDHFLDVIFVSDSGPGVRLALDLSFNPFLSSCLVRDTLKSVLTVNFFQARSLL